jgi:hypothetical protein
LARGEAGKKMFEQVPNVIKRERRRDVIERGLDSLHFRIAVGRMELLLTDGRGVVATSMASWQLLYDCGCAFTPHLARLDHLKVLGVPEGRPCVVDWYRGIKARPSYADAIVRWEKPQLSLADARQWRPVLAEGARDRAQLARGEDHFSSVICEILASVLRPCAVRPATADVAGS